MAWTSSSASRNYNLTEASAENRAIQFLIKVKEILDTAGWTVIGYGDGVSSSGFNRAGVTDNFPTFPSVTGMDDGAWFCLNSASGADVVLQVVGTTGQVHMWWSASGGYTDDGVGHSTRVGATTPPSDEIGWTGASTVFGNTSATMKQSILYTSDAKSFVIIGVASAKTMVRGFFIELEDYKTGDTTPYVATWKAVVGADEWDAADLEAPAANEVLGWHPDALIREYSMAKVTADGVDMYAVMGPDPVTGEEPTLDLLCCCQVPGSYHVRGKLGGVLRVTNLLSTGVKLDNDRWMVIGDFCIDGWNSSDPLES